MHTTRVNDTIFHHDGGYDGDVHIVRDGVETIIPFEDILSLVADYVMANAIAKMENMSPKELLIGSS